MEHGIKYITNGVHEPTVNVSIEEVGHGLYCTVPQGTQVRGTPLTVRVHRLVLFLF